ncbi:cupin domain containing protein [Nitzschia inconspicua]|uniref:Bifunctional lysine-specific demethylase and histidyl-hydroxylase n=1 Tax=Nitzschia inconspicua TaxID=303405 RepID=A0A9K3KRF6_9STRA|nr:cupin domain containing protein [Nitzschia inconspicua]
MNPIDTGNSGMSRAAKKRAKKKQKQFSTCTDPSEDITNETSVTAATKKRSIRDHHNETEATISVKQDHGSINNNKRIKSTNQNFATNEDVNTTDVKATSSDIDPTNHISKASIPIETIPTLPPNMSLESIVSVVSLSPNSDDVQPPPPPPLTAKQRGACLLQTMVAPITLKEFYQTYWEKKPLLVRATESNKARFANLLSLKSIKAMTKEYPLYYGQDVNVTKYQKAADGVKRRITLDKLSSDEQTPAVRVDTSELWSHYDAGCTIRLLCPHKHNDTIQAVLSHLETEFQCMVGANAYLTPPQSSQGFAPHYDDIEAFCLQLEGKKRWKVYPPTLELPRTSSEDFTTEDLKDVKPVMDVVLHEGDLLYMPRGWIHQACTLKDDDHTSSSNNNHQHSLHLTISAMQQWAWIDLMEMVIPEAMEAAGASDKSTLLRQGLPRGFLEYMGVMYEETKDDKLPESLKRVTEEDTPENQKKKACLQLQEQFRIEAKKRIQQIAITAMELLDASCDQMAKRFLSERQPPALTIQEKKLTAHGDDTADAKPILPNTRCRLIRPGVARLVIEDDKAVVYHCVDNAREYLGNPLSPMEFEMDDGPAIEQLLTTVEPDWILVNNLFHDTIEDKIAITQALYDEGILAVAQIEEAETMEEDHTE